MRPYQAYQQMNVSTADPLRIVILLYEGAIKNLNQAASLFGEDDAVASARIGRTLDILHYLQTALDRRQGGDIAANLAKLYEYMRDRLNEANIQRDRDKLAEVTRLLQTLLEGWNGIAQSQVISSDTPPPVEALNLKMVG